MIGAAARVSCFDRYKTNTFWLEVLLLSLGVPPGLSITVTPDLPKGLYPVFPPLDAVGSNKNTSTTKTIRIKIKNVNTFLISLLYV